MGVDIIEADGSAPQYNEDNPDNGYFGKQGDTYPSGATEFTAVSEYQVTNITETDGMIYFRVNEGGETILLDIEDIEHPNSITTKKVFRDGQILIELDNEYYDLLGRHIR